MSVEELIAILSKIQDKSKPVTMADQCLVTKVEELVDSVVISDGDFEEYDPSLLN